MSIQEEKKKRSEYGLIPEAVKRQIDAHVERGEIPGSFVYAVLSNNLKETIGRADEHSMRAMKQIIKYCVNIIPHRSWGSEQRVLNWAEGKRDPRKNGPEF